MTAPRKDRSIRDDTTRVDMAIPKSLMQRIEIIAEFLGLTKRGTILAVMNEGCSQYEKGILDAEETRRQAD